jgi:hypothetical protein
VCIVDMIFAVLIRLLQVERIDIACGWMVVYAHHIMCSPLRLRLPCIVVGVITVDVIAVVLLAFDPTSLVKVA